MKDDMPSLLIHSAMLSGTSGVTVSITGSSCVPLQRETVVSASSHHYPFPSPSVIRSLAP